MAKVRGDKELLELSGFAIDFVETVEASLINGETKGKLDAAIHVVFKRNACKVKSEEFLMVPDNLIAAAKNELEYADLTIQYLSSVFSNEVLAAFLSVEVQNEESAVRIESEGHANLAALCRRKC